MGDVIERCPTGIKGFDRLCQGGFVRDSDNLVVGGPGSGKTTFLLEFLWNGATMFNENGVYCSFEPDVVDILKDGMVYGWDFTKLNNLGKIKFIRFAPQTSIEELKSELMKVISKNDVKRICFDPISVIGMNLGDVGKTRQVIFEISSLMKRLKVTSVFADECSENEVGSGSGCINTGVLRFLSDSVTIFYESGIAGVGDRALRIAKMRRTSHERGVIGMKITQKGIEIIDPSLVIKDFPKLGSDYSEEEIEETNLEEMKPEETLVEQPQTEQIPQEQFFQKPPVPKIVQPQYEEKSNESSVQEVSSQNKTQEESQVENLRKAKEFIQQTKLKGYTDGQIKEMFINKGWDKGKVEILFKL